MICNEIYRRKATGQKKRTACGQVNVMKSYRHEIDFRVCFVSYINLHKMHLGTVGKMSPMKTIVILLHLWSKSFGHVQKFERLNVDQDSWNNMGFSLRRTMRVKI